MAIPIHREMRHPESFLRMFGAVSLGMGLVFAAFAMCGYVFFLDAVQQVVLSNLPTRGGWFAAATVLVLVELVLSFPLVFFPISWAVEKSIAPSFFRPYDAAVFSSVAGWKTNIVRGNLLFCVLFVFVCLLIHSKAILVMLVLVPATLIPRVSLGVALAGAFSNALSGIILPTLFHLVVFWDSSRRISKAVNIVLLALGVFAMAVTSTLVIAAIANAVAGNS